MSHNGIYFVADIATEVVKHKDNLAQLRDKCKEAIALHPTEFDDDLFLLRFCLSHKSDAEKRIKAVTEACQWRFKHKDLLAKIRAGERHPALVEFLKYCPCDLHKSLADGSPVLIVRQGLSAPARILDGKMKVQEVIDAIIFQKEEVYAITDAVSRQTGKVIKMVSLNDGAGFGWQNMSKQFLTDCLSAAMHTTELCYPQLLGCTLIFHPPTILWFIMSIAKAVLPTSTMEKIKWCNRTPGDDIRKCSVATRVAKPCDIPTFLGGTCTCIAKGGCVSGIPNSLTSIVYGNERMRGSELVICKIKSATITVHAKDYPFRLRILLNGGPVRRSDDLDAEYITVPAKKALENVALSFIDLGPYLVALTAEGKPEMKEADVRDKLAFILDIEKLDAADSSKVIEKKEKRVDVEFAPYVAPTAKIPVSFGETADMAFMYDSVQFTSGGYTLSAGRDTAPDFIAAAAAKAAAAASTGNGGGGN
jgi:hypothetical protein